MELTKNDLANIVMLLDRVETKGISEAYALATVHSKLKQMFDEQDQEAEASDPKEKRSSKA